MRQKRLLILILLFWTTLFLSQNALGEIQLTLIEYARLIQEKVSSCVIYPKIAEEEGLEGVVKLNLTLLADGEIQELSIADSSGYPLLDEAAILAVEEASPYPSLLAHTGMEELALKITVAYEKPQIPSVSEEETVEEVEVSEGPDELDEFIELAIRNNPPTQIAQDEVEHAFLKVREARRGLFPGLLLKGYNTMGEVYGIGYDEREVRLQLDHPLYYGGRLKDTLKQAKVNLEITEKNYDKIKIDLMHKTETAYYNLVAAQMNLEYQEKLKTEGEKILELVKRQYDADLVTPLEISNVQSKFEQICFQLGAVEQDLAMARLTFQQVLNVAEPVEIGPQKLEFKKVALELQSCLDAALENRPEAYLSDLLVQFNEYEKKIAESKNKFSVDFTTSYGKYEGAYETEPMKRSDNWYVGLKATKPLGGSTLTPSVTSEETEPRFGQTSPTKSTTLSAEVNLLNNLQRISEEKKAQIGLERAMSDLNETEKTITFEVQEALLASQKAANQVCTALGNIKFHQKEVEVLRAKASVGEEMFSEVLRGQMSLAEANSFYIQALANYYIALANLKKATGYGIKL
jgi:TonB family protein